MEIAKVVNVFIVVVDYLVAYTTPDGKHIYFESKNSRYINFKPVSFRKKLSAVVGKTKEKKYMEVFRTLELIKVDHKDRYTNIQWLQQKSVRVICIDKEKFMLLKELIKDGCCNGDNN